MTPLVAEATTVTLAWVVAWGAVAVVALAALVVGAGPALRAAGTMRRHPETRVDCPACGARRGRPCRPLLLTPDRWAVHDARRP